MVPKRTPAIEKASDKANYLDQETRALLGHIKKTNNKAIMWFILSWSVLLIIGVAGIYRQNQIAVENKQHIDCIVKLFTTPLPPNARSRSITNPTTTCNIKFNP